VTIDGAELDRFAKDMITQIATLNPSMSKTANPLATGMRSKNVTITPTATGGAVPQAATTVDQLNVVFSPSNGCLTIAPATYAEWMPPSPTLTIPFEKNGMGIKLSGVADPLRLTINTKNVDLAPVPQ
jgi:hypothetical protein